MNDVDDGVLDLSLLRAFDALLAERHVTRAAHRLRITQSAASHALGRLRRVLGDPLFVRGPRGVVPTDRAIALGPEVRSLLDRVEQLGQRSGPLDPRKLARTFTLAGADFMEILLLPPLLKRLSREAPLVDLASRAHPADLEGTLASGEIDLVLGVFGTAPGRLVQRKLFDETFVCVMRRGHPALKTRLTPERYAALSHVLISPQGRGPGAVDEALAKRGLSRRVAVRTSTFLAAPLLVAETDFVLTLPTRVATVMTRGRPLVLVPPPLRVKGFTVSMLFHERAKNDPAHVWLRTCLSEVAGALGDGA